MTIKRWEVASVGDASLWIVYDDITQNIYNFEVRNPGGSNVRLTITRTGKGTEILEYSARQPRVQSFKLEGVGKRTEQIDDSTDFDLPLGLKFQFETRPTINKSLDIING